MKRHVKSASTGRKMGIQKQLSCGKGGTEMPYLLIAAPSEMSKMLWVETEDESIARSWPTEPHYWVIWREKDRLQKDVLKDRGTK
jgi:hypothetical protein